MGETPQTDMLFYRRDPSDVFAEQIDETIERIIGDTAIYNTSGPKFQENLSHRLVALVNYVAKETEGHWIALKVRDGNEAFNTLNKGFLQFFERVSEKKNDDLP